MTDRSPKSGSSTSRDGGGRGLHALERLRERVEAAAAEIERLRAENAELTARVQELAALDVVGDNPDMIALSFDEDPEAMRAKVQHFIDALDRMLAEPADEASESTT